MSFAIFYLSNWINLIPYFIYPKIEFNHSPTWSPYPTKIPQHPHQPTQTYSSHYHQHPQFRPISLIGQECIDPLWWINQLISQVN